MKYLEQTFSVAVGSEEYRKNWDGIFGAKCMTNDCSEKCQKGEKLCKVCLEIQKNPILCDHANEARNCYCEANCYCKVNTCKR